MSLREIVDALVASEPFERLLLERARPIVARAEAAPELVAAGLAVALDVPVMAVTPGPREADALAADAAAYLGAERVALLPQWEALPYEGISPAPEVAARRASALHRLRDAQGPFVLVAPALAAMQGVIPTLGATPSLQLVAGVELAPDALADRLVDLGYARADVVEHRGEFAVRGGVVDVFPGTARRPVRLEYWGDEIESLREFTPSSQLSTEKVALVDVPPVRELIPDDALRARAAEVAHEHADRFADQLQRLADGLFVEGAETLAPFLFEHLPTPAELLPEGAWVVLTESHRTLDRAGAAFAEAEALAQALAWPADRASAPARGCAARPRPGAPHGVRRGRGTRARALGDGAGQPGRAGAAPARARRSSGIGSSSPRAGTARSRGRARSWAIVAVEAVEAPLANGFVFGAGKLARRRPRRTCSARGATPARRRGSRRRRDGVDRRRARARGLRRPPDPRRRPLRRHHAPRARRRRTRLPDPGVRAGRPAVRPLRPGRGWWRATSGATHPRLHRMGGTDWARATAKVKQRRPGHGRRAGPPLHACGWPCRATRSGPTRPWQARAGGRLPARGDRATSSPRSTRSSATWRRPKPMDRLICGDVGFGKTEIAVRAAFKAVMDGKQVAVLVPTTLLAEQHFMTFSERFAPFPVTRADAVAGSCSPAEQKRDRGRRRGGQGRRRDRHASAARPRHGVQGSRPAGRGRGAAVRRGAQGAVEAVPRAASTCSR